jgi:hypothetical protein
MHRRTDDFAVISKVLANVLEALPSDLHSGKRQPPIGKYRHRQPLVDQAWTFFDRSRQKRLDRSGVIGWRVWLGKRRSGTS